VLERKDIEGGERVEGLPKLGDGAGFLLAAFAGGLGEGDWWEGRRGGREGGRRGVRARRFEDWSTQLWSEQNVIL
jgi:hypothetical protein